MPAPLLVLRKCFTWCHPPCLPDLSPEPQWWILLCFLGLCCPSNSTVSFGSGPQCALLQFKHFILTLLLAEVEDDLSISLSEAAVLPRIYLNLPLRLLFFKLNPSSFVFTHTFPVYPYFCQHFAQVRWCSEWPRRNPQAVHADVFLQCGHTPVRENCSLSTFPTSCTSTTSPHHNSVACLKQCLVKCLAVALVYNSDCLSLSPAALSWKNMRLAWYLFWQIRVGCPSLPCYLFDA